MTKIKNCPFCYDVADIQGHAGSYGYTPAQVWVQCSNCGARTRPLYCEAEWVDEATTEHAITLWNTRDG